MSESARRLGAIQSLFYALSVGWFPLGGSATAQVPATDPISDYIHAIDLIESEQSSYAGDLSDLYLGLGRAFIAREDFKKAKRALQQGMQIERINNGLNSLSQSPYLLSLANAEGFMSNWKRARSALDNLYQINRQTYGARDPRMLPVLDQILDWFLTAYAQRTISGGYENLVVAEHIGQNMDAIMRKDADPVQASIRYKRLAYLHYMIADHIRLYGDTNASGITFSTGESLGSSRNLTTSHLHFQRGRHALEKVVEALVNQGTNNLKQQALAVAQLGDWYLVFDQRQAAKRTYKLASDTLKTTGFPETLQLELFDKPSVIQFNAYEADSEPQSLSPTLEVSMTVSALGLVSNIEVANPQRQLTKNQLANLKRNLRNTRLRPRLIDGESVASSHRESFPQSILER